MFGFGKVTCSAKAIRNVSEMMNRQMQVTRNIMAMVESMCEPEEELSMEQKLLNLVPDSQKKDAEKLLNNMKFKKVKSVVLTEETIDTSISDEFEIPKNSLKKRYPTPPKFDNIDRIPTTEEVVEDTLITLRDCVPAFVIDDIGTTKIQCMDSYGSFMLYLKNLVGTKPVNELVLNYLIPKLVNVSPARDQSVDLTDYDIVEIVTLCVVGERLDPDAEAWAPYYVKLNEFLENYLKEDEKEDVSNQPIDLGMPTSTTQEVIVDNVEENGNINRPNSMVPPMDGTTRQSPPKVKKLVTDEDCQ